MHLTRDLQSDVTVLGRSRAPSKARRWSWPHYLALVGVPILLWETWTLVAWFADGPHQITEFRTHGSTSWWAARIIEGICVIVAIIVAVYVVRGCRRERRILTFDVMYLLAGLTLWWLDMFENFFVPTWLPSSNWVNVNSPCGNMPFVVNPECGKSVDPILFTVLLESFVCLGIAILVTRWVDKLRNRRPDLTNGKVLAVILATGLIFDLIMEVALIIPLQLWTYPSPSWMSIPIGDGLRYPFIEMVAGGGFFALMIAVRVLRDDRGRTFVERGIDRHRPWVRKSITMFALYAYLQLSLLFVGEALLWSFGPLEEQWPKLPRHLVNEVCDAPGVTGTRYGPCPGSPGFRMPGRTTFDHTTPVPNGTG